MGIHVALAGNPNCGKTTMFNDLTGTTQYVGNWPGVTVEKKEGKYTRDKEVVITDLPGVYSLSPYSPEEVVTRDYLMSGEPDVVINLVDATNLERNLYFATQVIDLGLPVVIALNMMDLIKKNGDKINVAKLSEQLGCPIVETSALKGDGMKELMEVAVKTAKAKKPATSKLHFSEDLESALSQIIALIGERVPESRLRWYAVKLFEGEEKSIKELELSPEDVAAITSIRERLEDELDDDAESIITVARYDAITELVSATLKASSKGMNTTQKIDRVITNRWLGLPIFVVIMSLVYVIAVSTVGTLVTDWANDGLFGDGWLYTGTAEYDQAVGEWEDAQGEIEAFLAAAEEEGIDTEDIVAALEAEEPTEADEAALAGFIEEAEAVDLKGSLEAEDGTIETVSAAQFAEALEVAEPDPAEYGFYIVGIPVALGDLLTSIETPDWLQSLVLDGVIAGVGAVLGFVPQMIILFLLLSFLEDCGYMARVAFIMDRIFRKFGLSGKSFIPMLIASGCGVPAVMSTKTIENEKDRRMTIMTTTMIPCGAKMPIIALVFGALAGGNMLATWWVAPLFYFMGVAAIIISGIMLKKTRFFAGEATPFVMELPQYHLPAVKSLLMHTWERTRSFIVKAGTIIFVCAIILWFLLSFGFYEGSFGLLDPEVPDYLSFSLLAGLGNVLAWIFAPLGFGSWESTVATLTAMAAKENVVSTLGILFSMGEAGEGDASMWMAFADMLKFSTPAILAFCAFNLLCAPCFAAIGTIRRQMESAKWFWFAIGYMTVFAWCVGLMIYQFGMLATGTGGFDIWTIVAIIILAGLLFQLFRPTPRYHKEADAK
ncbi:MAG: ferrous iron transporter B [Coriobacteriaceae bacterium]|jgi:ferrous iron transport protein B|nr:ferrous iron transporter B [Coriobacteriaceae bacterium]